MTVARPLLPGLPGRLAVFGLAALAGWTLASTSWAPIAGNAYHAGQIADPLPRRAARVRARPAPAERGSARSSPRSPRAPRS